MNHLPSSPSSAAAASSSGAPLGDRTGERQARVYEPPCIEDDLALEVMSLACTGYIPKVSLPVPCRVLGS